MRRILALSVILLAATAVKPPATKKIPVTDSYYDVKVVDNYRWLENPKDPAVVKWVAEQNRFTRAYLDAIPHRDEIAKRLKELNTNRPPSYGSLIIGGGHLVALQFEAHKEEPLL